MNRNNLAYFSLLASAFVLAGLLIVTLSRSPARLTQPAHAGLVLNKGTLTMLTAQTRPGEEALFILDNVNEKLLIYRLNIGKKQLELAGAADLPKLFPAEQPRGKRGGR